MILDTLLLQPVEKYDYDIDCTTLFNSDVGDSVSAVAATCTPVGLTVAGSVADASTAKVWIDVNGADAGVYTVEVLITSSVGRKAEAEFIVVVEDIEA